MRKLWMCIYVQDTGTGSNHKVVFDSDDEQEFMKTSGAQNSSNSSKDKYMPMRVTTSPALSLIYLHLHEKCFSWFSKLCLCENLHISAISYELKSVILIC